MKKVYLVLASILSTAILNGGTSASAQSLFGGVPSVVRSCHEFSSRDWTAPDTASFLRSIACQDPNQDLKDENHRDKAELGPVIKASMAAYHARLRPAPDVLSSPTTPQVTTSSIFSSLHPSPHSIENGDDDKSGGFFVLTRYSDTTGGQDGRHSTEINRASTGTTVIDEDDNQSGHADTNTHQDQTDIRDADISSTNPSPNDNHVNPDGRVTPSRKRRTFVIGPNGLNPSPRTSPYRGIFSPDPHPNGATYVLAFNPRGHKPGPLPDGPYSVTKPCLPRDNSLFSTLRFLVTWLLWRPNSHPRPSDPLFKPIRDSSPSPYRWTTPPEPSRRTFYLCLNGRRPGDSPIPSPSPSPSPNPSASPSPSLGARQSSHPNRPEDPSGPNSYLSPTTPQEAIYNHFLGLGPKASLGVDGQLEGQLQSWTGESMIWPASDGCIIFGELSEKPSAITPIEDRRRVHSTLLLASRTGALKRVFRARKTLRKQMEQGIFTAAAKDTDDSLGWLPWRRRNRQDVERARVQLGRVVITLDERGRLEVTIDGMKVLSRSGPHKREWRNRLRRGRKKSSDYKLYVVDDGVEVRLGERTVWGVTADHNMH